jgi:hypothetical protein
MKSLIASASVLALIAATFLIFPHESTLPSALGAGDAEACARLDEAEYIGVDGCKKCHFKQWMSWKKTDMAKSFETLKAGEAKDAKVKAKLDPAKDYTKDATCVECHTTGYGKTGGYPAIVEGKAWTEDETKRAAAMEGVQCESCHGPGSLTGPYKKDHEDFKKEEVLKLGMIEPDKDNCLSCHNDKNPTMAKDAKFDYEAAIKDDKKIHVHVPLKKQH